MKCLLVTPRWSDQESLLPPSGRPHLDLLCDCLGFSNLGVFEWTPGTPFDPAAIDEQYRLILVQGGNKGGRRLRRSLLSNLGLSLGLDGDDSDRLRVMGARPLYDADGNATGFAIKRRGRIFAYCEHSLWGLRLQLMDAVRAFLEEEHSSRHTRFQSCWMIEGAGKPVELTAFMIKEEADQCRTRLLPNGDTALLIPIVMGEEFRNRVRNRLGNRLYAQQPRPLEELLAEILFAAKVQITVAESCTGGLIAARLSSIPGSSNYLASGFITYSNIAKTHCLDVNTVLLQRCGAVSPEVALAMARGALRAADCDLSVSATGIAGPGGGTPEKPVGTVHLAAASKNGGTLEHHGSYRGTRDRVRYQTSQTALHLLRRLLLNPA